MAALFIDYHDTTYHVTIKMNVRLHLKKSMVLLQAMQQENYVWLHKTVAMKIKLIFVNVLTTY